THWNILDPIIALVVAVNVVWTGLRLLRETSYGLLDTALPADDQRCIRDVLARFTCPDVEFHALRTRRSGSRRFVSMHVLVPGTWTGKQGPDLLEDIESAVRGALPEAAVFTHLEPREDPLAFADQELDRESAARSGTSQQSGRHTPRRTRRRATSAT